MDDLLPRYVVATPEITIDVERFAARAAEYLREIEIGRVLRILVTRDGAVVSEIVGKGGTLKPIYGGKVGGPIWIAEGDELLDPSVDAEDILDPLPSDLT